MAAREADHIGNQPMLVVQRLIGFLIDRGMTMPAEGLQRLLHKRVGLRRGKTAVQLMQFNQLATSRRKDIALRQDRRRFVAQRLVLNQLQPQQRSKNAKRIARTAPHHPPGETPLSVPVRPPARDRNSSPGTSP